MYPASSLEIQKMILQKEEDKVEPERGVEADNENQVKVE
jgi:hypothetical protein